MVFVVGIAIAIVVEILLLKFFVSLITGEEISFGRSIVTILIGPSCLGPLSSFFNRHVPIWFGFLVAFTIVFSSVSVQLNEYLMNASKKQVFVIALLILLVHIFLMFCVVIFNMVF